jgi:hypothetical protein
MTVPNWSITTAGWLGVGPGEADRAGAQASQHDLHPSGADHAGTGAETTLALRSAYIMLQHEPEPDANVASTISGGFSTMISCSTSSTGRLVSFWFVGRRPK